MGGFDMSKTAKTSASPMAANQRSVAGITPGIARVFDSLASPEPANSGGGNLNGSANQALLLGQAGTSGQHLSMPRHSAANGCGII